MSQNTKSFFTDVKRKLTPTKVMIIGYLCIILVGAALLCFPFASRDGVPVRFIDALYTAVSASCVTGLVVFDTAVQWSGFGQGVILFLIQIGGLGFITLSLAVMLLSRRRIGLKQRVLMQESISAPQTGGIVRLTRFVVRVTIIAELLGAALMSIRFVPRFGLFRGIYYAIFHSISAFCNAGFDVMGREYGEFASFTGFADDLLVNLTLCALIVFGGLGFFVWADIRDHRFRIKRYSLQTKTVLSVTAVLILLPTILLFIVERGGTAFAGADGGDGLLAALFHSISTRTAGMNTVDMATLAEPSKLLTVILMLVGGSPGSTAGGMKTTTVFVLILCVVAQFKKRDSIEFFKRRIDEHVVRRSVTIVVLYTVFFLFASAAMSLIEGMPVLTAMFESASAIGTVGLSTGATPALSAASKLIEMFLMFFGRMGGLTMLYALTREHAAVPSRLPLEQIAVG